jgi:hypothetical protein
MGKNRGSTKTYKRTLMDRHDIDEISTMFEQMIGSSDADVDIIIPKMLDLCNKVVRYHRATNILLGFNELGPLLQKYEWDNQISEFLDLLTTTNRINIKKEYNRDDLMQILELKKRPEVEINEEYKSLKNNQHIKQITITCGNLDSYKKYLENKDKLEDTFIRREPGDVFSPISFTNLDLKLLWFAEELSDKAKKIILTIMHHMLIIGQEIYEIVASPDIDISKFSSMLVDTIAGLRKQIPRCDKAFDIIENSVKMLEDNFTNYYRSSVVAENPSIIALDFISDVSNKQKTSPIVMAQFHRIMSFLREQNSNVTNPKTKEVLSMLNGQFSMLGMNDIDTDSKNVASEKDE